MEKRDKNEIQKETIKASRTRLATHSPYKLKTRHNSSLRHTHHSTHGLETHIMQLSNLDTFFCKDKHSQLGTLDNLKWKLTTLLGQAYTPIPMFPN